MAICGFLYPAYNLYVLGWQISMSLAKVDEAEVTTFVSSTPLVHLRDSPEALIHQLLGSNELFQLVDREEVEVLGVRLGDLTRCHLNTASLRCTECRGPALQRDERATLSGILVVFVGLQILAPVGLKDARSLL